MLYRLTFGVVARVIRAILLSVVGSPGTALDWVDVLDVHRVNLLKGPVLGLDKEEEDDEHKSCTASCKNKTVQVVNSVSNESSARCGVSISTLRHYFD